MKTIAKIKNLKNKIIFLRVDFNAPIKKIGSQYKIEDDFRIKQTMPTIKYLLKLGAKIILATHFSKNQSAKILIPCLKKYFKNIIFVKNPFNFDFKSSKSKILLIENLRKWPGEEKNNENFAKKLANLADIYVNDAFGVCHRNHASISKITNFLPPYAGLLLSKEINALSGAMRKPKKPLVVILGGAKISTKIMLIKNFLKQKGALLIAGAIANTVLKAKNIFIGKSNYDKNYVKKLTNKIINNPKLIPPTDAAVSKNASSNTKKIKSVFDINKNDLILDIGPKTIKGFSKIIKNAKTVIFNGPLGLTENKKFQNGTIKILKAIAANKKAFSIVGGGDTLVLVKKLNLYKKFSFVSSGGGAMLKFLSGEKLPGIEALN